MIFIEAILKVGPGKQREFNELLKQEVAPAGARHGLKLVAAWGNLTGPQDIATDLWACEDFAHLQRVRDSRAEDPAFAEIYRKLATLSPWETTKVLMPLRYHPADALGQPAAKPGLLMTARLTVGAGQMAAFLDLFEGEFLPRVTKNGMQLVGAFRTGVGHLSEILDLWRFDSIEQYWAAMRAISGDSDLRRLLPEIRQLAPDETITLHHTLPYSPFR